MLANMKEQMKEQQAQSDCDRKQASLDREKALREQEALRRHNDNFRIKSLSSRTICLHRNQIANLRLVGPNLQALDELIQKWIAEARLQGLPTSSAVEVSDFPFSKEIQECEFSKFSTLTFDYYSGMSDLVQYIRHFQ